MDALDRKILSILQDDGRMSTTDLAREVGLSLSSGHRRVKELEASGAVVGYRAVVDPRSVGLGFEAVVFATMSTTDLDTIAAFEAAVAAEPSIVEAQRLFGEPDYLLRVLVADMTAYQEFYDSKLGALPGVQRLTSTLVMKQISGDRVVPIP